MKTKPLTFLLALTFLFLFSGYVFGQEEVRKEYDDDGNLRSETHYKDGKQEGLKTLWTIDNRKWAETDYKNGKENGVLKGWHPSGKKKYIIVFPVVKVLDRVLVFLHNSTIKAK